MTGSRSGTVYRELSQDDPRQRQPDISLAEQDLDWRPKTSLESGPGWTIDYFRTLLPGFIENERD
jgi:UDP-glucuronate decarboxylase